MRPETLAEMRRLLAPDGLLLLIDWERGHTREGGPPDGVLLTPPRPYASSPQPDWRHLSSMSPFAHRYVLLAGTEKCGLEER